MMTQGVNPIQASPHSHRVVHIEPPKTCPKCEGGLGIRKTEYVNAAFLGNKVIKFLLIWIKLIKAKYLKNNLDFFQVTNTKATSIAWKIFKNIDISLKKVILGIGNGITKYLTKFDSRFNNCQIFHNPL